MQSCDVSLYARLTRLFPPFSIYHERAARIYPMKNIQPTNRNTERRYTIVKQKRKHTSAQYNEFHMLLLYQQTQSHGTKIKKTKKKKKDNKIPRSHIHINIHSKRRLSLLLRTIVMRDEMNPHVTLRPETCITNLTHERPQLQMSQLPMSLKIALPLKRIRTHVAYIALIRFHSLTNTSSPHPTTSCTACTTTPTSIPPILPARSNLMYLLLVDSQRSSRAK